MYYDDDELKLKIKSILRKYKVKYRSLDISDDNVVVGIESYLRNCPYLTKKFSTIGLRLVYATYGRWTFKR